MVRAFAVFSSVACHISVETSFINKAFYLSKDHNAYLTSSSSPECSFFFEAAIQVLFRCCVQIEVHEQDIGVGILAQLNQWFSSKMASLEVIYSVNEAVQQIKKWFPREQN